MPLESSSNSLAGKVALVTGGASGIGAATVAELAARGASIAVLDLDEGGATRVADSLEVPSLALGVDLSNTALIPGAVQQVLDAFGQIDILINCAGTGGEPGTILDLSEKAWDFVHTVNLKAPFLLIQEVARHMVERGEGGRIVNVSSSSAFRARQSPLHYSSAKAALVQVTRVAAAELGPHNINVNAVAPGITRTGMTQAMGIGLEEAARSGALGNLFQRVSEPPDVAAAIVFLCLPESRQITAQTIHTSAGAVV